MSTVVLLSGGVDSLMSWFYLNKPKAVHVDLGTPYSAKEKLVVQQLSKELGIDCAFVDVRSSNEYFFQQSDYHGFFPARNLLLATIGSWFGDVVCIAGIRGDLVEDKNPKAYVRMTNIITRFSRRDVVIMSPFWNFTKGDILSWYMENEGSADIVRKTVGCYHPTKHQCGECTCCFRKWVGMRVAGIDPGYNVSDDLKELYSTRAVEGYYDEFRCKEILQALEG